VTIPNQETEWNVMKLYTTFLKEINFMEFLTYWKRQACSFGAAQVTG
jgi:hypothetical protein